VGDDYVSKIDCIVTNLPWQSHHKERLEKASAGAKVLYIDSSDKAGLKAALAEATVALLQGRPNLADAPRLKWLHMDAAGLDGVAKPDMINSGITITGSAGRSAPALSEHIFFFMLSHAYRVRDILAAQAAHTWGYAGQEGTKALYEQTLGIIGMGNTGRTLAPMAKAFGMRVMAYSRKAHASPGVDVMLSAENGDSIDRLYRESDYIAMCAALTDKTYRMIGEREIGLMKPSAVICNVGRGKTIDEAALIKALKEGRLAGAGLDTFEMEPLPKDSPIWDTPNLIATPHFTPPCPDKLGRSLDIMIENIALFLADRPLNNVLTAEDLYTK
jgi:phosphoglycerate dehydrogenase-like enzyme